MEKKTKLTNKETVERWAEFIIPAVFSAEEQLLKFKPEWTERLRNLKPEELSDVSEQYCREIAEIIVRIGAKDDGTL